MGVQFEEAAADTKYAKVLYDFTAEENVELTLKESDVVIIHQLDGEWCYGELNGKKGWFPLNFIEYINEEEYNNLSNNRSSIINTQKEEANENEVKKSENEDDEKKEYNPLKALERQIRSSTIGGGGASHRSSTDGKRSWYSAYQGSIRYKPKNASLLAMKENGPNAEKNTLDKLNSRFSSPAIELSSHQEVHKTKSDSNILSISEKKISIDSKGKSDAIEFVNGPAALKKKWVDFIGGQSVIESMGLSKTNVKRQEVIYEMIDTERDYVNDLSIIIELYIKPIRNNNILQKRDLNTLFSNVEQLYGVNQELLSLFEKRQKENPYVEEIGDIWLTMNEYLKMYMLYCGNYAYAITRLEDLKSSKSFTKFLNTQFHKKESRSLKLESFLIKPVQRICKYPLLLRELIKYTDESNKDYNNLIKAYARLETVVTVVNGASKEAEAAHYLIGFQSRFNPKISIVAPSRRLKYKCEVNVYMKKMASPSQNLSAIFTSGHNLEKKKRLMYIFDDMIIIAKSLTQGPDRLEKGKLKLIQKREYSNVEVRSIKNSKENNLMNAIEITLCNPDIMSIVFCETDEEKNQIINHLTDCIREYQSLNTNESGPNIVKSLPSEKVYSMISNKNQDPNEEEEEGISNEGSPTMPEENNKTENTNNEESKTNDENVAPSESGSKEEIAGSPKLVDDICSETCSEVDKLSPLRNSEISNSGNHILSCSSFDSLGEINMPQDESMENDLIEDSQNQDEFNEVIKMLDTFICNSNESLDEIKEYSSHEKESSVIIKEDEEDVPPSLLFKNVHSGVSPFSPPTGRFGLRSDLNETKIPRSPLSNENKINEETKKKENNEEETKKESRVEEIKKEENDSASNNSEPSKDGKRKSILNRISFYEKISLDSKDDNDDTDYKKSCQVNLPNNYPIRNACVDDVLCKMKNAKKYYVYEITVNLNNTASTLIPALKDCTGRSIKVYHTFEEFFDFHFQFIEATISNRDNKNNISINKIPTLPSQIQCINDRIARKRISGLQSYINGILNLITSISSPDIVYNFLASSGFDSLKLMEE